MRFTETPATNTYFLSGTGFQLSCQVECIGCVHTPASPVQPAAPSCNIMYQWSEDGNLLSVSSPIHRTLNNGTLVVMQPARQSSVYRCIASNDYGSIASDPVIVKLAGELLIRLYKVTKEECVFC